MFYRKLMILFILMGIFVWCEASSEPIPLESLVPKKDLPEGWVLIHGPQTYIAKTLFEHINGQAELFFKYGFQKSIFAIYQNKRNPNQQIELDIYDMGNVLQAFGIFSRFRNEDRPMDVGLDSFLDEGYALFYKGRYFVMFYATEPNPSLLKEWAMKVSLRVSDSSPQPKEIGYFPAKGLQPGSIQYFPEGLLGHQFLGRGFQGAYKEKDKDKVKTEGKEFYVFLAIFKNSEEAMSGLKKYREELSKKGKVHSGIPAPFGSNGLMGEDPYRGKVFIIPKGLYLGGILGFENVKNTKKLLEEFIKNIQ
jgi:hypothetical protein